MKFYFANLFSVLLLVVYFDFLPNKYVLKSGNTLDVTFYKNIKDPNYIQNLKIRPVGTNSLVYIFDQVNNAWVSPYSLWTQMPVLSDKMIIRPVFSGDTFLVSFDILDTKTSKIYKTNPRKIWNSNYSYAVLKRLITKIPPD